MSFPHALLFLSALAVGPLAAAQAPPAPSDLTAPSDPLSVPAVHLDVQRLVLDSLSVEAERIDAHLRINASVAELLRIEAGLSVRIDSAHVALTGLDMAAEVRVQLDVVARVLLEALGVVDRHPDQLTPPSAGPEPDPPER